MTVAVSEGLRRYYVWYLANSKTLSLNEAGLCPTLYRYSEAIGLGNNDSLFLRLEQDELFKTLYHTAKFPFGSENWSPYEPRRRAHVLRYVLSPELRQFYLDWARLSSARRPNEDADEGDFYLSLRKQGLCCCIDDWAKMTDTPIEILGRMCHEQNDLFRALYGTHHLPFNASLEDYYDEALSNRNYKRNKHVRMFSNV